ncbi:hypothetical protein [Micromonospora sp. CPCC 206061]|uniref:hypothetical protein n=1 Tax=Micromonospora sp. CPCC 206061 TaxID=3122410 RepID=UPI002FF1FDB0
MSDEYMDPSGNTEAFRSFATEAEPEQAPSKLPLVIGVAVLAVVLVALTLFLAFG